VPDCGGCLRHKLPARGLDQRDTRLEKKISLTANRAGREDSSPQSEKKENNLSRLLRPKGTVGARNDTIDNIYPA